MANTLVPGLRFTIELFDQFDNGPRRNVVYVLGQGGSVEGQTWTLFENENGWFCRSGNFVTQCSIYHMGQPQMAEISEIDDDGEPEVTSSFGFPSFSGAASRPTVSWPPRA